MAKWSNDAGLDTPGDYYDQSTVMVACSAQPTTYTEATSTYALADVTMTADTDYPKADGTTGRKITVASKSAVPVDASGTATHVALCRVADTTLRFVTTCTSQALTAGNTVNFPNWKIEVGDPT